MFGAIDEIADLQEASAAEYRVAQRCTRSFLRRGFIVMGCFLACRQKLLTNGWILLVALAGFIAFVHACGLQHWEPKLCERVVRFAGRGGIRGLPCMSLTDQARS